MAYQKVSILLAAVTMAVMGFFVTPAQAQSDNTAPQESIEEPLDGFDSGQEIITDDGLAPKITSENQSPSALQSGPPSGELSEPVTFVRVREATPEEYEGPSVQSRNTVQQQLTCNYTRYRTCDFFRFTSDNCETTRPPVCERVIGTRTTEFRYDYGMNRANSRVVAMKYGLILRDTGTPPPESESYSYTLYSDDYSQLAQTKSISVASLKGVVGEYAALGQDTLSVPQSELGSPGNNMFLTVASNQEGAPKRVDGVATIRCGRAWTNATLNCVNPRFTPTITYSRSDLPYITENISSAIAAGSPTMLTRVTGGEITANRDAVCGGAARRQLEAEQPQPAGMIRPSCDEYPFASSQEGGAGAHTTWVPRAENDSQGLKMRDFYRLNQVQDGERYRVAVSS